MSDPTHKRFRTAKIFWEQRYLHAMVLPVIAWLLVFKYLPILGIQIAFKDYRFADGIWRSPWVGFKHMVALFTDVNIVNAVVNTLGISFLKLIFQFPAAIIFALMLNEVRHDSFRRVTQTMSYFPHFIGYSIVALLVSLWLGPSTGFVNNLLMKMGILKEPYLFLGDPKAFWWIILVVEIWKNVGWNSIIYLAAMAGVSPEYYEAAILDGAGRFARIWHITLPSIRPTIMALFVLQVGNIMKGANFDLCYLLGNPLNTSRSEILDTYVMRIGISLGRFSYGTSVGLLLGIVSLLLVTTANSVSKRLSGEGLF
jgi:putative aldouronate transport system permease protein